MVLNSPQELQNQEVHEVSKRHIFGRYGDLKCKQQENEYNQV